MKKLFVLMLAVVMVAVFAMPATAADLKFGGYFDVSFATYKNLNYTDTGATDYDSVRSRNRMYFTAKIHENLSVITKFEMDTEFGQDTTTDKVTNTTSGSEKFGDLGADGIAVEVKNAYMDFNLGQYRFELGVQGFNMLRGLIMNDDASGAKISYRGLEGITPALWWFRPYSGAAGVGTSTAAAASNQGKDMDQLTLLASIKRGNMQFVPYLSWLHANDGVYTGQTSSPGTATQPLNVYWLALDFNAKFDMWNLTLAGAYEGGSLSDTKDITAYMFNAKADVKLANFKVYGEFLYTTGEDGSGDYDGFWYPENDGTGANYSTAEFVRKGKEWMKTPSKATAPAGGNTVTGNGVENRMEFGLGTVFNLTKNVSLDLAWWNLNLAEDAANGNKDIGNEIDAILTWNMMKNLKLDLIAAYLIVGDAIKPATNDASYAYEGAALFSVNY